MQTGTKFSLAGHGLLVGWAAFGGWFSSEPLPIKVQEVAVISTEEFAKLSQQVQAPEVSDAPGSLAAPDITPEPPDVSVRPAERPEVTPPVSPTVPQDEAPIPEAPEPEPEPEVSDTLPVPVTPPAVEADVPPTPPSPEPQNLRPADRVAPIPVAPPEPEVALDDIEREEIAPDAGGETAQEPQQATAPEAASDRIVTEANEGEDTAPTPPVSAAPATSVRPKTRPRRPTPTPAPATEPEPQVAETAPQAPATEPEEAQSSAIEDALAAAISGGADVEATEPSGPPLTPGEKESLRVSVSRCWNVGSLSSEALKTTVEVAVSLEPDGRPKVGTIRMVSSTGGTSGAAKQAYEAARRAIIRCGADGFQLPGDKYDHWRDIVMTFNPEKMRIK